MARQYQIFGEALVNLRFGVHVPFPPGTSQSSPNIWQLGLSQDAINITVHDFHFDVKTDSYGPDIPPETLCYLGDAEIRLKLVHYDNTALGFWLREAFAGGSAGFNDAQPAGIMPYAGTPMGGGLPIYASGNHYVGLGITSAIGYPPWRFPSTYLAKPPVMYPVGTKRIIAECSVRAIPYTPLTNTGGGYQAQSFGTVLFDHQNL